MVNLRVKLVFLISSDTSQGALTLELVQTNTDDVLLELVFHELVFAVDVHVIKKIIPAFMLLLFGVGKFSQFGVFLGLDAVQFFSEGVGILDSQ